MIDPRGEREADLAHDLRPHVERLGRGLPFRERQRRPELLAINLGESRKSGRRIHGGARILRHLQNSCDRERASLYQTLAARVGTEVAKRGGL